MLLCWHRGKDTKKAGENRPGRMVPACPTSSQSPAMPLREIRAAPSVTRAPGREKAGDRRFPQPSPPLLSYRLTHGLHVLRKEKKKISLNARISS